MPGSAGSPRAIGRSASSIVLALLISSGTVDAQPAATQAQPAADNRRCLNCHGQERLGTLTAADRRGMVAAPPDGKYPTREHPERLFVNPAARAADVHRDVSCTACHPDAATLPHSAKLKPADCSSCHAGPAADLLQSVHAEAALKPGMRAPHCGDCHGSHDIRRKNDPAAQTYPLNVIKVCGGCHEQHTGSNYAAGDGAALVDAYLDSVHGRAIAKAGLVVAASCADCHGAHDIRASSNPESRVARHNVPNTCGRCHVGIEEAFATSVHAEANRSVTSKRPSPVCSDCHSAHHISRADTPAFMRDISTECGTCHAELYRTYRESYHGQVQRLGSTRAARCSDCHGAHNIRRPDDPHSTLSAANRPETCAKCHTELKSASKVARVNFAKYSPHADYRDRRNHPILYYIWLYFMIIMGVTFTFWGLHSIAWFARGTIQRRRHGPRHIPPPNAPAIQRFTAWHRWTHALVIVSFLGLTITGLPLKFSDHPWSRAIMRSIGGPHVAGFIHRCCAVLVVVYLAMHLVHIFRNWRGGDTSFLQRVFGPNSMLPMPSDWRQFKQMVRWFFGRGPKPKFDRWTYWEKFDYWADLFGTAIIGLSGLLLWFPEFFASYLSGYWFNVATVIHGYEALLAAGFIFSIHFFNAHLRWEKFPVDEVIFTGQLPEEEFREERAEQFERLVKDGQLEALRVPPAPPWQHVMARVIGLVALVIGTLLIVLIVLAGFQ